MRSIVFLLLLGWWLLAVPANSALAGGEQATTRPSTITVRADQAGTPISPDLFGIFFEDLNYAADGGLYAELIQNRSFEYSPVEQRGWTPLTGWELGARGGGKGSLEVAAGNALCPSNPQYAVLNVSQVGDGVGLVNSGFDGIPLKEGESYDVSIFTKYLYSGTRWSREANTGNAGSILVRFESKEGENLGEATIDPPEREWKQFKATITAKRTEPDARFVLLWKTRGGVALDEISVIPRNTFHNHPNGLRADLAQTIADLKPRFVRFPGGCLVHGDGIENIYRWKDTIGAVEQRKGQRNLWGYHQSVGLGFFEYFQFCEDIGAKPLPVVAAGVCCQNSGHTNGVGQCGIPTAQMPDYVQDLLDLIEWANGPATSTWGAKRAAAGHPAPFNLQYIGVGNEDRITADFKERFKMIFDAVKAKHPEITVIGTVGPGPSGEDYDEGWKFANELSVPIVDEHYYETPEWFTSNLNRYDSYDRSRSKVYVGEYAAHDVKRQSTLRSALAEAMYMTSLERNGDVVHMASYAPLLGKIGHTQWNPDLIYFTNTQVAPTINYQVQRLFGLNSGDRFLSFTIEPALSDLAVSTMVQSKTGDLIIKLVNTGSAAISVNVHFDGAAGLEAKGTKTVLTGDPMSVNALGSEKLILPVTSEVQMANPFSYEVQANSLTIFRVKQRQ